MNDRYRYDNPHEWLESHIAELDTDDNRIELLAIIRALASVLDNDQIQDLFQSDMDADGYFQPLDQRGAIPPIAEESCMYVLKVGSWYVENWTEDTVHLTAHQRQARRFDTVESSAGLSIPPPFGRFVKLRPRTTGS